MATYDYGCPDGHVQEVRHGMNESPVVTCGQMVQVAPNARGIKKCGKTMSRMIGSNNTNFVLKGSGWYSVDSRVIRTASDVHGTGIT